MVARHPENAESGGAAHLQAASLLEDGQRPHMKFLFKGVDFFPHDTRWKIIERRYIFIGLSWGLAMLAAVLLMTRGLNYGVDFKGGSLIEVQSKAGAIDIGDLRTKLDKLGIGDVQVQAVGLGNEALIRVAQQVPTKELNDEKAQAAANDKVKGALGENIEVRRIEVVGPTVSSELKRTGVIAVVASMFGILLYVWFRFEWQFAVAAILALSHDVFITVGMFSLLWYEFDLAVVAAILTLAGYSINDTVVVFDRIRENLRRYKRMPMIELLNLSINETLSRTVLTSVTTALAVLALYIFGTQVIHGFSFAMLFGIVIGTYSSIFVAAPFLLLFGV
ncbi:MAG: protein translocase subunit SecF, partial [Alphaproteobacteria bacterium]